MESYYRQIATSIRIPADHTNYLRKLRDHYNFYPKVIYDIGACVGHWFIEAHAIWPKATIIAFDANKDCQVVLEDYKKKGVIKDYFIGLLSNVDEETKKYYYNDLSPGGNSYYFEVGTTGMYDENRFRAMKCSKLDTLVQAHNLPIPDLVKMDVQGCEHDIFLGGLDTIKKSQILITELQCIVYNRNAPLCDEVIKIFESHNFPLLERLFSNNGPDGDYSFYNSKLICFTDPYYNKALIALKKEDKQRAYYYSSMSENAIKVGENNGLPLLLVYNQDSVALELSKKLSNKYNIVSVGKSNVQNNKNYFRLKLLECNKFVSSNKIDVAVIAELSDETFDAKKVFVWVDEESRLIGKMDYICLDLETKKKICEKYPSCESDIRVIDEL